MVQPNGRERRVANGFGLELQALREQAGLTQERLAGRAGLSVRTIRALEHGQARPRTVTARLLGEALGLDGPARARFDAAAHHPDHGAGPVQPAAVAWSAAGLVVPAQLPADVAGFTGRGRQLRALDALLWQAGDGQPRRGRGREVVISAIAGAAGVGKTALAVHWAHRVRGRFDGQLYVDLHGYTPGSPLSPLQALAGLLGALGVAADRIPVEVEQAAGLYRSLLAERRVLVVLDNARSAEQVRPLVPGSPGCVVVVTSRDRLGGLVASHGARRLTLEVLAPEEAVGLLAQIVGLDRVRAEPEAAARLAEVCGLLPLALRVAAANLTGQPSDHPIAGYLARLGAGDRLAELAVDGDPQAAVRTAFDCSYGVLDADARRLFGLLGLLPGPDFTSEAAAALAGVLVGRARGVLERLAGAHLVEPRGAGRFGLHDLLRLYARQRSEQEEGVLERRQALDRLLGWYLQTADAADRLVSPEMLRLPLPTADPGLPPASFDGRADALGWLDAERPNLVSATRHAAAHGPRLAAWLLADVLRGYFWGGRHMVDWLAVANAALCAADADGDPQARAAARRNLGLAYYFLGDYVRAAEHHTGALALARQAGWVEGEAATLGNLAMVHTELGHLRQAADHHARALALNRQIGSKAGQAIALGNLGRASLRMGTLQRAVDQLTQALALAREIASKGGQATVLGTLGEAYRDLGRLDDARVCLTQALALARAAGYRYEETSDLYVLATVHRETGQFTLALELAKAALALAREIGDPRKEADALNTLGSVQACLGHHRQATAHHHAALDLARRSGARQPQAEALLGLAAVHLDLDHDDEAVGHARQAVALHRETGHRLGHARALVALGHGLHRAGDATAARSCWQEALALLADIGAPDAAQVRTLLDTI